LAAAGKALEAVPGDPDPPWLYAELLLAAGERRQAKEQAEKALAMDPARAEARNPLGRGQPDAPGPGLFLGALLDLVKHL